ncbi:hypothetical protein VLK31_07260 [Variovorax sp. H27-G14]|uniref:hypothetical protein n=1 Tax=Variovorax sp. H27-G14 TaxID=3111914 RepID=UPI0038FC5720
MKILSSAILCVAITLAGCQTIEDHAFAGYSVRPIDKDSMASSSAIVTELKRVRTIDAEKSPGRSIVSEACFANFTVVPPDCQRERNEALSILMMASSNLCLKHRQSIYGREAATNVTFGTLTNFFAGAAAVVNSDSAKTLYAALALFSNSERSLVNETVYKQMVVTAVDKKIVESYESKMLVIDGKMNDSYASYGIYQGINDITTLHNSCSFMSGLGLALEEGTKGSKAKKISTLRGNLMNIENDRKKYCVAGNSADQQAACTNVTDRAKAVTISLTALESSLD